MFPQFWMSFKKGNLYDPQKGQLQCPSIKEGNLNAPQKGQPNVIYSAGDRCR